MAMFRASFGRCLQKVAVVRTFPRVLGIPGHFFCPPPQTHQLPALKHQLPALQHTAAAATSKGLSSYRLSLDEAFDYMEGTLGIGSAPEKLRANRVQLLGEIVRQTHRKIPFQVITNIMGLAPNERHIPTFDEIKRSMFSGQGGVCYDLNVFTNRLLSALGFDVILIGGSYMGNEMYHVTNVVRDLEVKGTKHLVDVGASDPTFRPIPLDFEDESPNYYQAATKYKFKWSPDGALLRLNKPAKGNPDVELIEKDGWYKGQMIVFKLDTNNARDLSDFEDTMAFVYMARPRPKLVMFTEGVSAMVYTNDRMVYIRNHKCYLEQEDGQVVTRVTRSPEELLATYASHFPMLPQKMVEVAIKDVVFPTG